MTQNPILKKLGFSKTDRVVIIHASEVGLCHSTISAFIDLTEAGLVSSGAILVPSPWFPYLAEYCSRNPQVDVGVDLIYTSDWGDYRCTPVSNSGFSSELFNRDGYFPRTAQASYDSALPMSLHIEAKAQIERALNANIDITHINSHRLSALHTKVLPVYAQAANEYCLPVMIPRFDRLENQQWWQDSATDPAAEYMRALEQSRQPGIIDYFTEIADGDHRNPLAQAKAILDSLPQGLSHISTHPAKDTPGLRAIATTDWQSRVADYKLLMNGELQSYLKNEGIHLIGYREIRDAIRPV